MPAAQPGFNQLEVAIGVPIAIEKAQCARPIEFVNRVPPPVSHCQIQPAVAVEITRRDAGPPSRSACESPSRGHVLEVSVVISKDAHRPPFEGQREVRLTISVQVSERGPAHQSKRFKWFAEGAAES